MCLMQLPPLIHLRIFENLKTDHLNTLRKVNRQFRKVIDSSGDLLYKNTASAEIIKNAGIYNEQSEIYVRISIDEKEYLLRFVEGQCKGLTSIAWNGMQVTFHNESIYNKSIVECLTMWMRTCMRFYLILSGRFTLNDVKMVHPLLKKTTKLILACSFIGMTRKDIYDYFLTPKRPLSTLGLRPYMGPLRTDHYDRSLNLRCPVTEKLYDCLDFFEVAGCGSLEIQPNHNPIYFTLQHLRILAEREDLSIFKACYVSGLNARDLRKFCQELLHSTIDKKKFIFDCIEGDIDEHVFAQKQENESLEIFAIEDDRVEVEYWMNGRRVNVFLTFEDYGVSCVDIEAEFFEMEDDEN